MGKSLRVSEWSKMDYKNGPDRSFFIIVLKTMLETLKIQMVWCNKNDRVK